MILAVDPDVLRAAEQHSLCDATVADLVAKSKDRDLWFAVDGAAIEQEYAGLLDQCVKSGRQHKTVPLFLKLALTSRKKRISPTPSPLLRVFLEETPDCTCPVEPELLGMAESNRTLALLLVGEVSGLQGMRPRGLNCLEIRRRLRDCIGDVNVYFAIDTEVVAAPFRELLAKRSIDHWFEDVVALRLQAQEPNLRCIAAPSGIRNLKGNKEQIDVYGYRMLGSKRVVFVGECKLPQEGNECSRLVLRKDVKQTLRKLMAAAEYESQEANSETDAIIQMEAAVISTAGAFWESERELIAGIQCYLNRDHPEVGNRVESEFSLRFMQARLRQDFMRQKRLRVLGIETWRTWTISCERDGQGSVSWRIKAQ